MTLDAPNLDDRTADEIVREAKTLIPRYLPEWTDQNPSDPGITLVELFAWMTEMMLYRFNRVPERHYVKFLELLGITRHAAQPATVDVTFTPRSIAAVEIRLPRFTQLAVAGGPGGDPIVFEVDRGGVVLGAKLDAILLFDGRRHVPLAGGPYGSPPFRPFGDRPRAERAVVLSLDSTAPSFTREAFDVAVYVAEAAPEERNASTDSFERVPAARIAWEFWDGSRWRAFDVIEDGSRAFLRSGFVTLRVPAGPPTAPRPVRARLSDVGALRYYVRARLEHSEYDRPPELTGLDINTFAATQAVSVFGEILGRSTGLPNQTFRAGKAPIVVHFTPERRGSGDDAVIVRSVELAVIDDHGVSTRWQEVDDFDGSLPTDRHFTVDHGAGTIAFGDGAHGLVPRLDSRIVATAYRYGGGSRGRVGAGVVTELLDSVIGIDKAENRRPSNGGSDLEGMDDCKRRARGALKSKGRAVTAEDFEHLTRHTPLTPIALAKALPLVHPGFPGERVPGSVTVIAVPDIPGEPRPLPSEATLRTICAWLDRHRLLTTEVHVTAPCYRNVRVEVDVIVRPEFDLARVERAVSERLLEFLHPIRSRDGEGWPFGESVFYSAIYQVVLETEGVLRVEAGGLHLIVDGELAPECRDVDLAPDELASSDGHDVRVRYATAAERRR
jgi:predicted phage baseplate assembly protein